MLRLDFVKMAPKPPVLERGPVRLRVAEIQDFSDWTSLRESSRAHLTRWEPDWRPEDITAEAFRLRLRNYDREIRAGTSLPLYMFRQSDGALVGAVTLSEVRYQALCSATIGYWVGADYLRRGYGYAGVSAVLAHAFETLGLNRIEAACQPGNEASRNLLRKCGFHEEGYARDFLYINGAWRDHMRYAITARDNHGR